MKILVCGSRDWQDSAMIWRVLDAERHEGMEIVEGGAKGADTIAKDWAVDRGVPIYEFPAQWNLYGKGAGPIRNAEMLAEDPGLVIAFMYEGSKGTQNMVDQATEAGVPVTIYRA